MQNSKNFCPVCLMNLLKVWQEDVKITQSVDFELVLVYRKY